MARRKQSLKDKFLRRSARGSHLGVTRRRRLPLHLEQLEQRLLLNADNNPAPLEDQVSWDTTDDSMQIQPIVSLAAPVTIGRFVLADFDFGQYEPPEPFPAPEEGFESVEELRAWVVDAIDARYGDLFGTSYTRNYWPWYSLMAIDLDLSSAISSSSLASGSVGASSSLATFSDTNVQVEGVDEADLIETDGEYLYVIAGNELIIIDATNSENLSILSRVELEDRPTGIYLSGDRLTLISSNGPVIGSIGIAVSISWDGAAGYDSKIEAPTTTVTVLDLSDRMAPSLVQRTELRGSLVSSRMVDGQLRLVLSHRAFQFPQLRTHSTGSDETGQTEYTYETRDEYLDRVLDDLVDSLLPTYRTFSVDGEVIDETRLVQPNELRIPDSLYGFTWTTIATFDVLGDAAGPTATKTLISDGANEVYSTEDSLYVFGRSFGSNQDTTIWKFDFDSEDHSIELAAKGSVEGTLLNQFAADEHDGYLRVVTRGDWLSASQSLFVLEQVGQELEVVGSVENIAPGERLYSVRFMEDRAFVVTFRRVDPLFAIDLSDPENPTIAGELIIPGYSEYLQPIDENHLLGIGRGTDSSGRLIQELQISIFDVSDLDNPQLAHRYSFEGGSRTGTIATGWGGGTHHAVSYFPSVEILAIPVYNYNFDLRSLFLQSFGSVESTLQVFSVNVETGFEPLAVIEHDSPILRSLQIGDALLAFSAGEISSHDITDPTTQLDSLQLLVGSDIGLVELKAFHAGPSAADLQAVDFRMSASFNELFGGFSNAAKALDTAQFVEAESLFTGFVTNLNKLPFSNADAADSALSLASSPEEFGELVPMDQETFEHAVDTVFDVALL